MGAEGDASHRSEVSDVETKFGKLREQGRNEEKKLQGSGARSQG